MIHFVIGTRAQLFKMAPIMLECEKRKMKWRWVYTAQHKDTIQQTLDTFGLPKPDYTVVSWNTEAKSLSKFFGWFVKMLLSLFKSKKILGGYTGKEHIVLTHGDTTTTWFAALYGRLTRTKVMHVEAGLRSHKLFDPFPEEINRIITGWLANYHICPGQSSVDNLKRYRGKKINTIYNTQADTINFGLKNCNKASIKLPNKKYAVVSIHRYENIFKKERFAHIIDLIKFVSKDFLILFVLHPATKDQLEKTGLINELNKVDNIDLLPRQEYLPFVKLIKNSEFVISDGGGNQEELYFMGKPTLLFRNATERPDELGKTAVLSMLDKNIVKDFLEEYKKYQRPRKIIKQSPSSMIVDELMLFA